MLLTTTEYPAEEDDYETCAGDAMRRCFITGQTLLEGRIDWLVENKKYTACYVKEAETCPAVILKHYIGYLKAYERHLKKGQGKLGKMVEEIPSHQRRNANHAFVEFLDCYYSVVVCEVT